MLRFKTGVVGIVVPEEAQEGLVTVPKCGLEEKRSRLLGDSGNPIYNSDAIDMGRGRPKTVVASHRKVGERSRGRSESKGGKIERSESEEKRESGRVRAGKSESWEEREWEE